MSYSVIESARFYYGNGDYFDFSGNITSTWGGGNLVSGETISPGDSRDFGYQWDMLQPGSYIEIGNVTNSTGNIPGYPPIYLTVSSYYDSNSNRTEAVDTPVLGYSSSNFGGLQGRVTDNGVSYPFDTGAYSFDYGSINLPTRPEDTTPETPTGDNYVDLGLLTDATNQTTSGQVSEGENFSYYFEVANGETIFPQFDLYDFTDDLDLSLYKWDSTSLDYDLLQTSDASNTEEEWIFKVLSSGDYALTVFNYQDLDGNGVSDYTLVLDAETWLTTVELPDDPLFYKQWHLFNTGQGNGIDNEDIYAPEAWGIRTSSPDVTVAVLDDAIDLAHEDLINNLWTNPGEIPNNNIDDDNNGLIDDYHGYSFVNNSPLSNAYNHGTHVAGTIGAEGNNNIGVTGVTWDVNLMSLDTLTGITSIEDLVEPLEDSIYYAVDYGADVINMSLGRTFPRQGIPNDITTVDQFIDLYPNAHNKIESALNYAVDNGTTVVIAAGNDNKNFDGEYFAFPAYFSSIPGVISVAATANSGQRATYTNYGSEITIGAPGGDFFQSGTGILENGLFATAPNNPQDQGYPFGPLYGYMNGTSMAAPVVAGAVALLYGENPDITPAEVETVLKTSATKRKDLEGFVLNGGALDLHQALLQATSIVPTPGLTLSKSIVSDDGADAVGDSIKYQVSVKNTGSDTLYNVNIADPLTDLTKNIRILKPTESVNFDATYTLTQSDLDLGTLTNTATATTSGLDTQTVSIPLSLNQNPKLDLDKSVVSDEGADEAGDKVTYKITVTNEGNQTLTDIQLTDSLVDLSEQIDSLAPGETKSYNPEYVITQQDINTNGGGDGIIKNTATASSKEAVTVSASTSFVLDIPDPTPELLPKLSIQKIILSDDGADEAGDIVEYSIVVSNSGNQELTNITVSDPLTSFTSTINSLAINTNNILSTEYILTQTDIDTNGGGDGKVENTATANSDQTGAVTATAEFDVIQNPNINFSKLINQARTTDFAGDSINYSLRIENSGNQTLSNVIVNDPLTSFTSTIDSLAPNEVNTLRTAYPLSQADIDTNGGGDGAIENVASIKSDQTSEKTASASYKVTQSPKLQLNKSALSSQGGDKVGDVIQYSITVGNGGNQTLSAISVSDPLTSLNKAIDSLAPGENKTYITSYTLSEADFANGNTIVNTASANSSETDAVSSSASVPIALNPNVNPSPSPSPSPTPEPDSTPESIQTDDGYTQFTDANDVLTNQYDIKYRLMGGDDYLEVIGGLNNFANGNTGQDTIVLRGGFGEYLGGKDSDTFEVIDAEDGTLISANRGADIITGSVSGVIYRAGKDDDVIAVSQGKAWGDLGNDVFRGVTGDGYAEIQDYTIGEDVVELAMEGTWSKIDSGLMFTDTSGDQVMLLVGISEVDQLTLA